MTKNSRRDNLKSVEIEIIVKVNCHIICYIYVSFFRNNTIHSLKHYFEHTLVWLKFIKNHNFEDPMGYLY